MWLQGRERLLLIGYLEKELPFMLSSGGPCWNRMRDPLRRWDSMPPMMVNADVVVFTAYEYNALLRCQLLDVIADLYVWSHFRRCNG